MTTSTHIARQEEPQEESGVQIRTSDPGAPVLDQLWLNTSSGEIKFFDGSIQVISAGETGVQGVMGDTGTQGDTGIGAQGETGVGPTGMQGPTGPFGGAQGDTGVRGVTGPLGGDQGTTGLQGIQGATGAFGETGVQGIQGDTGSLGITGDTGVQGDTGIQGYVGFTGIQGVTGLQGFTGAGIQGITGNIGNTGVPGETGTQGDTGIQGATGDPGGPQGSTGVEGQTGIVGDTGKQGVPGIQGLMGVTGLTGTTGPSAGPIGETGLMGPTGVQGDTGVAGATGVAGETGVQGIQGDTGIRGFTGVQGVMGDTGLDEKVKITASDTTNGYLTSKLLAATGISKTIVDLGLDEKLELASDLTLTQAGINDPDTDFTGLEAEELTDGSTTILHFHTITATILADGTTDISTAELEELSDGSTTTLHNHTFDESAHDALPSDNPHTVSFTQAVTADGGTDITAAEAEELTDGSNTALHNHNSLLSMSFMTEPATITVQDPTFDVLGYIPWDYSSNGGLTTVTCYVHIDPSDLDDTVIQISDLTNSGVIGTTTISGGASTDVVSFSVTAPSSGTGSGALLVLEAAKSTLTGTDPDINAARLEAIHLS